MRGYFFVFKRTLQSGNKIFYYQAYKPDGTLSTARSTGCIRKREAVKFCESLLMEGKIWTGTNLTFAQYATHFFDNDSIWVQDKLSLGTKDHPAINTVGRNKSAIEKYIRNQWIEDKESEQLEMKELFDPFTGEPAKGCK